MDPITLGSTIACAYELYEMGAIPEKDVPFPFAFGDAEGMVKLVDMTAKGEGFGNTLALGSYRMAEKYGHPELSMSVKKQEMPAYDGRAIQGIGLEYATSNRGGCHVRGYMISPEVLGLPSRALLTGKPPTSLTMFTNTSVPRAASPSPQTGCSINILRALETSFKKFLGLATSTLPVP